MSAARQLILPDDQPHLMGLRPTLQQIVANNSFLVDCFKGFQLFYLLSELEFDFYCLLAIDWRVEYIVAYAVEVSEVVDGERINTIPDFWIKYRGGMEEYIEVKPKDQLVVHDGRMEPSKWPAVRAFAARTGARARFVTEDDIDANPLLLSNAHHVRAWAHTGYRLRDAALRRRIAAHVAQFRSVSLEQLGASLESAPFTSVVATACHMACVGELRMNVDVVEFNWKTRMEAVA